MACPCGYRKRLREDRAVSRAPKVRYLDYCATAPVDPRVLGAWERACRGAWGNPSSAHARGIAAAELLDGSRAAIGAALGLESAGIAFCASGSEALHAALWGLAARDPALRFATTPIEHAALRAPLRLLRGMGRSVVECPVGPDGRVELDRLDALLSGGRSVFCYSPVNHETGAVQDAAALYAVARARGALVLMDAVQAAPRLRPELWAPYADMTALSAHKLCCPKGSAFLWKRPGIRLRPFRFGGVQEGGLFPGTENAGGVAAFAEGARLLAAELPEEAAALGALEKDFFGLCGKRGVELVRESPEDHAPGVFCVSLPWASDMDALMTGLARAGFCLSRFSACADRIDGASRILKAMGRSDEAASRSLRIGIGRFTVRDDLAALAGELEELSRAL